jgi:alkylation response protein AidB-like acyl-CoA dehydrogenase
MALITLNNEQKIIQNEIRKFTRVEVEPIASEIDTAAEYPSGVIEKLDKLAFLGAIIPEKYGGAGLDTMSLCIIIEELARASASIAMIVAVHNCSVAYPLLGFGTSELQNVYLSKLASGTIGGCVLDSTLDAVNSFKTTAAGSMVQVSGISDFVLNGIQAGVFTMQLVLQDRQCIGVFDLPHDVTEEAHHLLGLRSAGITRMKAERFEYPLGNVINQGTNDQDISASTRAYSDIGCAAISLGIAEACCDTALAYSKERKQFNRAICEFPMIREMLVDMRIRTDTARLLVYNAAQSFDRNEKFERAAHSARLFADATAVFSGTTSVQVHGGYGYTKDYPVERFFRDAKAVQAIGRPDYEIKEQIAKELLS